MQCGGTGGIATNQSKRMLVEQDRSEHDWESDEPDNYREPDEEDFAYMVAQEREVTSLRSGYHEADKELRNYQRHTDRQLRALYKARKRIERHLARAHHFDVFSDSFEVQVGEDASDSVPWPYGDEEEDAGDNATRALTRKDKRRTKTKQRKAANYLRIGARSGRNHVQRHWLGRHEL